MREGPAPTLVTFTADHLAAVLPWFDHPEVRRRLGGREWPRRELRLLTAPDPTPFRGRTVLRVHSWLAVDGAGLPVGKIGGDVYDRWTVFDPSGANGGAVVATEPGPALGLAYVVDPARWGQGWGRRMLQAVVAHRETADVVLFTAGIDDDNLPSRRCAAAAGFRLRDPVPDAEGTVYYQRRRAWDHRDMAEETR